MIQYADVNVGPADYNHLRPDEKLLVTKIFGVTLQGEGPFAGIPAVFIRLAGCNKGDKVSCPWCDTNFIYAEGTALSISAIRDQVIQKFEANGRPPVPLVIITGGEPMLQDSVVQLCESLLRGGYRVQIESNGDRLADGFADSSLCHDVKLVVSPKVLPSSKLYRRLIKDVFNRADYLKFVVEADPASAYHRLPPYVFEWSMRFRDPGRVFVSPATVYNRPVNPGEMATIWTEGLIDREATARNYTYAANLCCRHGYRLTCQLHTLTGVE